MKTIAFLTGICLMALLLPALALGAPYVACTPQIADGFSYSLDDGEWVDTEYYTIVAAIDGKEYAVVMDTEIVTVGPHSMIVKAYVNDPTWGRLESSSVPFDFVKPVGTDPTYGIQAPQGITIIQ